MNGSPLTISNAPATVFYEDRDRDGYYVNQIEACSNPNSTIYVTANSVTASGDCNDNNANINPGASEICNDDIDNNCDGGIDDITVPSPTRFNFTADSNSLCSTETTTLRLSDSENGRTYTLGKDGSFAGSYTGDGGPLEWTGMSSGTYTLSTSYTNCDGGTVVVTMNGSPLTIADEQLITYYEDRDRDGYYVNQIQDCSNPDPVIYVTAGSVTASGDCNDNNADINPGIPETCDGIDNNCSGQIDDGIDCANCPDDLQNEDPSIILPNGTFTAGLDSAQGTSLDTNNSECALRVINTDNDQPWARYQIAIDLAEHNISAGDFVTVRIDGRSDNNGARFELNVDNTPNTALASNSFSTNWTTFQTTVTVPDNATTLDMWFFSNYNQNTSGVGVYDNLVVTTEANACSVPEEERLALLEIYNALDGDNWLNTQNNNGVWQGTNVCEWYGVEVNDRHVISIQLNRNGLSGIIPISIASLTNLSQLFLDGKDIQGVPAEIQNLNMQSLWLGNNALTGNIPSFYGNMASLVDLRLNNNLFEGPIPSNLSNVQGLNILNLSNNRLSGPIPDMTALGLTSFRFEGNNFVFSDFENEHNQYLNAFPIYTFSPQAIVDTPQRLVRNVGEEATMTSVDLTSNNNSYQWFRGNGIPVGNNQKEFQLTDLSQADSGIYYFIATNSVVDGLELRREAIELEVASGDDFECTEVVLSSADGSFQSADAIINSSLNGTLSGTGWTALSGTPDTLDPFYPLTNEEGLVVENINFSPQLGYCAGALFLGDEKESFGTTVENLEVGKTYIVEFYQANASAQWLNFLFDPVRGNWKVTFNGETQYSSFSFVPSGSLNWSKERLEFTANAPNQDLAFEVDANTTVNGNTVPVYMLIDGIRIFEKPTENNSISLCNDLFTEYFCSGEEPTIADLVSPFNEVAIWFDQAVGGQQLSSNTLLSDILNTIVYAQTLNGFERTPVEFVLDENAPMGEGYQEFNISDSPTLADIEVEGSNIIWKLEYDSSETLPLSTPLENETIYYAFSGNDGCGSPFEVVVRFPDPLLAGLQQFCSNDAPTVADLAIETTDPTHSVFWYSSTTDETPLNSTDALQDGATYYAVQTDGTYTSQRNPVRVSIFDVVADGRIIDEAVSMPLESTIADLNSFLRMEDGTQWWDDPYFGTTYSPSAELFNDETYYIRISLNGSCPAGIVLAINVVLSEVEEPELVTCIKYVPQPGRKYVIGAWVREQKIEAVPAYEMLFENEAKDDFVALLNHLKDKVLSKQQIPDKYVLKEQQDAPDVKSILPFVKDNDDRNLTVYNFSMEEETVGGVRKAIGFSFALTENSANRFVFRMPFQEVPRSAITRWASGSFMIRVGPGRYPLRNYDGLEIDFVNAAVMGSSFDITANVSFPQGQYGNITTRNAFTIENHTTRSTTSGVDASVQIFDYIETANYKASNYGDTTIQLEYKDTEGAFITGPNNTTNFYVEFAPTGSVIDGWQRVTGQFTIPANAGSMRIVLKNKSTDLNSYFDDVRVHPQQSNLKSFVYDPLSQRLMAELDENNYATFYEYDLEGGLVRVKKETERGVYTIQETRSGNSKLNVQE